MSPEVYDAGEQLEVVARVQTYIGIGTGGRYQPFVFYLPEKLRCLSKKTRSNSYGINRFIGTVKQIHAIISLVKKPIESQ